MARPRKNRIGEYARLLGEEIGAQLHQEISKSLADNQRVYREELESLRAELRRLGRRVEALIRRSRNPRAAIGRWVPGGPGRPPKDAADRIAAFEARAQAPRTPTRKGRRGTPRDD